MTSLDELARRIERLERQSKRMAPQLSSSSIEAGSVREYDLDGNLVGQYGRQYDGTSAPASFNGPLPPMPTTPQVIPVVKGVKVRWDGLFADGVVVPMNFARVELHASTDPAFLADTALTLVSTFETPRGGEIVVASNPVLLHLRLVARNLAGLRSPATPVVSATPLGVNDTDIESVGVAKLTTGELAAGQRIILGDENDAHAEATPDGFSVFRHNLETGQIYRSATLGDADVPDMLQIAGGDGAVRASINDTGDVVAQNLTVVHNINYDGLDMREQFNRLEGTRNVANFIIQADGRQTVGSEIGLFEFQFTAKWGHIYSWTCNPIYVAASAAGYVETRYRYTMDGSRPSIASARLHFNLQYMSGATRNLGEHVLNHFPFFWTGGSIGDTRLMRVLVSIRGDAITAQWFNYGENTFTQVFDHGLATSTQYAVSNDGGGGGPPPPPPPQQYYWEMGATWGASWRGNGSKRTDTADLYQGYVGATNGLQTSAWGWPDLTAMLAGSVVDRAEAYLYTPHWSSYSGGIACIGFHQQLGEPAGPTGALDVRQYGFARGQGRWIDLADWRGYIQDGSLRGLALVPPNTSSTFYGYAAGDGQAGGPALRLWFTK